MSQHLNDAVRVFTPFFKLFDDSLTPSRNWHGQPGLCYGRGMLALVALLATASSSSLQMAQAEGSLPGVIVCSPASSGSGGFRANVTVEIGDRRARYTVSGVPGGTETGSGALGPDRTLTLSGKGRLNGVAYTTQYAGPVNGRGGTLTGSQRWASGSRSCQLSLGDGRG